VAAMSGELYRVDAHGVTRFVPRHGLANDPVESLFADAEGRMWVGTTNDGLFNCAEDRCEHYTAADGLPGGRVPVIAQAADNGVWLGTDGGLVRLGTPRFTVYTERDGLASDFIGSILPDRAGRGGGETRPG